MSIYQKEGLDAMIARIDKLTPSTPRQWGKMDAAQMLHHVRLPLEVGLMRLELPGVFMMKIFGPMIRKIILSDKELKKNSPTAKNFVVTEPKDFEVEKKKLIETLREFVEAGKQNKLEPKHKYFGKFTAADWDFFQQRHFNHHLTQFGV